MRADKDWLKIKKRQANIEQVEFVGKCHVNGKRQYPDEEVANKARKQQRKRLGSKMEAYKCRYCSLWHLGHAVRRIIEK